MPDYYNRYQRSDGWKQLRFQAGRGLQSAELNELQALLTDEQAQLAGLLVRDRSIVRGCEILIDGTTVTITSGQVFFGQFFHDVPGGQVTVTGSGEERIGIRFNEVVLTEDEDATLRDPAQNWENFGERGAHRLTFTTEVVVDDDNAVPLYTLRNGELVIQPAAELGELYKVLARRTNDESGSYMVRGLTVAMEDNDEETFWARIASGKAYVEGFEITVPAAFRLAIDRPLDFRTITAEAKTYQDGTGQYQLNARPVKQINVVTATIEVTDTITRGQTPGGSDLLTLTPVVSLVEVTQGATTFVVNTDYIQDGDFIDWSPGGAEPATGSTYTVTWRYIKTLVVDADYRQNGNNIEFLGGGDEPVDGSVFNVSYEAYLPRYDLIVMDREGRIQVIKGQAGLYPAPASQPTGTLLLATLFLDANADAEDVLVSSSKLYRQTMPDLARLLRRVRDLEYNAAVSDLEQDALNVEMPTTKKGIFTDLFRDIFKADIGHGDWSAGIGGLECNPAFATDFRNCVHPTFDAGGHVMLDFTETPFLIQPWATEMVLVNAYATFNRAAILYLDPADDHWVDETEVLVDANGMVDVPTRFFGFNQFWDWVRTQESEWVLDIEDVNRFGWGSRDRDRFIGRTTATALLGVDEEFVQGFSRAQTITVHGEAFTPSADNLELSFDGTAYTLTPVAPTVAGTNAGTIRANAQGAFKATFELPPGIPGGTKQVRVANAQNEAETQFDIGHIVRTTHYGRINLKFDPVAQSFLVEESTSITSVDLYFGAKDLALPVVVSIRSMVNGFPGTDLFAEVVMQPDGVSTSGDGSAATRCTFPRPAMLQPGEYCLVIASDSAVYSVAVARLGQRDLISGGYVTSNPSGGVLFSSANSRTWTPDQAADLKFRLHRAVYSESALRFVPFERGAPVTLAGNVLTFDNLAVDGSVLYIMADQQAPLGTGVDWKLSLDDGGSWSQVQPNQNLDTGGAQTEARLRATFTGGPRVSPILALPTSLLTVKWAASGVYIGRNVVLAQAYTEISLYVDLHIPSGTTVAAQYSVDGGANWSNLSTLSLQRAVNSEFGEYLATVDGLSNPTELKVRLNFTSSADRARVPRARRLRAIAV